jgi:hypothetical protein
MCVCSSGCSESLRVALRVQVATIGATIGIARGWCSDAPKGVVSAVSWGYFAAVVRLVEGRTASSKSDSVEPTYSRGLLVLRNGAQG